MEKEEFSEPSKNIGHLKWKDVTKYSRYDTERIPTMFELVYPSGLRIIITRGHISCPGEWVMHCFHLGIDTHPLNVKTQADAESLSIAIVKAKIKKWFNDLYT